MAECRPTSSKHDTTTYKTAVIDSGASGVIIAGVAGKVIKVHALVLQAQGTVTVNINNGMGGASLAEWSFQAREGAAGYEPAPYPMYWMKTSAGTALYLTLSAGVTVTGNVIYSDGDAS